MLSKTMVSIIPCWGAPSLYTYVHRYYVQIAIGQFYNFKYHNHVFVFNHTFLPNISKYYYYYYYYYYNTRKNVFHIKCLRPNTTYSYNNYVATTNSYYLHTFHTYIKLYSYNYIYIILYYNMKMQYITIYTIL